ncbi:MAG TPA: hypothetical protein VFZ53_13115, partial [Polyangiaceae bacterium]
MTGCCFKVAPFGDDALAEESDGATPFLNVQAAIDFADEHRELGTRICVAGGHACQEVLYSGPSDADLRMRNGISVIGNHDPTSYTQCPGSVPVTILRPETAPGVVFESDVQDDTALEGFIIRPGFNGARTVGVTARGANGVRLGSLRIEDGPNTEWCGIDLVDTAAAIRDVSVYVQNTNKSVAVQAIGSSVYLEGTLDLRSLSSFFTGIWLENSPGSRIAADVTVSNAVPSSVTQAVRLTGDAEGTRISESSFAIASFAEETTGILIEDCAGASPFLNATIVVEASELGGTADGVRSRSCHPRIENSSIAVRGDRLRSLRGVACESGSSGGSRCILVNDQISTT